MFRQAIKLNHFESECGSVLELIFLTPSKNTNTSPEARRRRERRAHEQDSPRKKKQVIDWDSLRISEAAAIFLLAIIKVCTG